MPRNALIAALSLPLIVLALGIVRAEQHRAHSQRFVLEVEGYDPRDLLHGHYIDYRLRLGDAAAATPGARCRDEDPDCCLCLQPTQPDAPPVITRESCEVARAQCGGMLATRYLPRLRRYYIPEQNAEKLDARFRDAARKGGAQIVVAIDPAGMPMVEALRIDGVSIEPKR